MFRRDVKRVSQVLDEALRADGLETPLLQMRLIGAWGKVAGAPVERYTREKFIRNQTLFVKIVNPAVRANLSMMRGRLVAGLNAEVGSRVIADVRFF